MSTRMSAESRQSGLSVGCGFGSRHLSISTEANTHVNSARNHRIKHLPGESRYQTTQKTHWVTAKSESGRWMGKYTSPLCSFVITLLATSIFRLKYS
jgi:hypothetical protein